MIICIIEIIWTTTHIISWNKDKNKTDKIISDLQNTTKVEEIQNDNIEVNTNQENVEKSNPYWDYMKMNLINVNLNDLKKINNETKGWIQVNGTNINYPFVQAVDNEYYLTHSFDKSHNSAGWIFLDYRNNINDLNKNTIIYAHGRYDGTMFGSLKNILSNHWLNNNNNHVVKLSTESENTLWQVFSVYKIQTANDYLTVSFNDDFMDFTLYPLSNFSYFLY